MLTSIALLTALALCITLLIGASVHILSHLPPRGPSPQRKRPTQPQGHILIVLGSGGHTAEMVLLLQDQDANILRQFKERTWVVSEGDAFSGDRAASMETLVGRKGEGVVATVPRARRVHQSLFTTPFDCLKCFWACTTLLRARSAPDIIITNGPGTGVILIFASLFLRFLHPFFLFNGGHEGTRFIYIESLARVKKLSLSGRILRSLVDRFIVQWEGLRGEFARNLVLDAAKRAGVGKSGKRGDIDGNTGGVIRVEI
jgi:beta-1,4-N-acetylglucosaminyltransferase